MSLELINLGAAPNDGTGDPPRVAGQKINANFAEVYGGLEAADSEVTAVSSAIAALEAAQTAQDDALLGLFLNDSAQSNAIDILNTATGDQATALALKAPLTVTHGTLAYAATVNLNMATLTGTHQTIELTGPLNLTTSDRAAGRSVVLRLINDGAERTLSFPSEWSFVGAKPTVIAAGFVGRLRLDFWGDSQLDCVADWRSGAIGVSLAADPDAVAYVSAVTLAGGTVSAGAQDLLSGALSATYNGLRYADYKAKIKLFWCPLSNFAGVFVPTKGGALTNDGFVSGMWNIQTGLMGNGSASILTSVNVQDLPINSVTLCGYVSDFASGGHNAWCGGDIDGAAWRLRAFGSLNIFDWHNVSTGRTFSNLAISGPAVGVGMARRNGSDGKIEFNGELLATSSSSGGSPPDALISLFGITGFGGNSSSRFSAFAIAEFLSDSEAESLRLMLNAIHAGRATLWL